MKFVAKIMIVACSVCFGAQNHGEIYKCKHNDGVEIKVQELQGTKKWVAEIDDYFVFRAIDFEISHNGKSLLKGRANVHPNSYLGIESDTAENGVAYEAVEFLNDDKGKCALSLRIQNEPIDEKDKKQRLKIGGDLSKCQTLKSVELENKIFYKE